MTNREIKYELMECLATTQCTKDKVGKLDKAAMDLMEERLLKLIEYFKQQHKTEMENVDKKLNELL